MLPIKYCRNCKADIKEGQEMCLNCGFRPENGKSYCQNCGADTNSGQSVCTNCGFSLVDAQLTKATAQSGDENSTGLNILAFFLPIVGLILYIVYSSQYPIKAKGIGKWALIGFVLSMVFWILF